MERDFEAEPYSPEEHRVAEWFASHGTGGGDDPIGALIACLEYRNHQISKLRAALQEANANLPNPTKADSWLATCVLEVREIISEALGTVA